MLDAFVDYERRVSNIDHHTTVGVPVGTRLQRIIRLSNGWLLWVATRDYMHGTYYMLYDNGRMDNITSRADEGDEITYVRPSDDVIIRDATGE